MPGRRHPRHRSHARHPVPLDATEARSSRAGRADGQTVSMTFSGIASPDPAANPDFYDATYVQVNYCSSDLWSGDRAATPGAPVTDLARWHFRGHAIVRDAVAELLRAHGLGEAREVFFMGSSAGGAGTLANVDAVRAALPSGVRFVALADGIYSVPYPAFDPATRRFPPSTRATGSSPSRRPRTFSSTSATPGPAHAWARTPSPRPWARGTATPAPGRCASSTSPEAHRQRLGPSERTNASTGGEAHPAWPCTARSLWHREGRVIPAVLLARALARLTPSAIEVRNDADDLVLDARGVSVAPALTDAGCDALLAAVEEALAGGAAFVEVTSFTEGGCELARWERPGEAPTLSSVGAPPSLTAPMLRVHVRERWGVGVVADFLHRRRPELDALREAAVAPRCPVTVEGEPLARPPALARAELAGLDDGLRGAIELVTVDAPASLTVCERGWAVASWPMPPLPGSWYAEEPLRDDAAHVALNQVLERVGLLPSFRELREDGELRVSYRQLVRTLNGTRWTLASTMSWGSTRVVWHPLDHERKGVPAEVRLPCRLWIDFDTLPPGIDLTTPPHQVDAAGRRAAEVAWRSLLDAFCDPGEALPEATQAALRVVLAAAVLRDGAVVPPWRGGAGVEAGVYRSAAVEGHGAAWLPTPAAVARLAELPLLPVRDGAPVSLHTLLVELARAPIGQLTEVPARDLRPKALAAEAAHADLAAVDPQRQVALLRRLRAVDPSTRTLSAALPWPSHASVLAAARRTAPPPGDAPTLVIEEAAWEAWRGDGLALQLQGYRVSESVYDACIEPIIEGIASDDHRYGVGTTRGWRWVIRARGTGIPRLNKDYNVGLRWELPGTLARDVGRVLLRLATTPPEALNTAFRVTHRAEGVRLEEVFAAQAPELFCLALSLDPSVVTAPRAELESLLGGHEAAIGALTDEDGGVARLATLTRLWVNLAADEALGAWGPEARADPWRRAAVRFVHQTIYRRSRGRNLYWPFPHEREASGALLVLHRGEPVRVVPLGATSPLAVGVVDDPAIGEVFSARDRYLAQTPERDRPDLRLGPDDFSWACHLENTPLARALCAALRRAGERLADPAVAAVLAPRLRALRGRFKPSGDEYKPVAEALAALPLGDDEAPAAPLDEARALAELAAAADPSPLALSPERRDALQDWLYEAWGTGARFAKNGDVLRAAAIWRTLSGRYVALQALPEPHLVVSGVVFEFRHAAGAMRRIAHTTGHFFPADVIVVPTATVDHNTEVDVEGPVWTSWHVPAVVRSIVKTLLPGAKVREECGQLPGTLRGP
jgi:hypothetical protein